MILDHTPLAWHPMDREVFRRYAGLSLPRHVAYPMPTWWGEMDEAAARTLYGEYFSYAAAHDLSLYVHIPFCAELCKFCACNRVILGRSRVPAEERVERYLAALEREIRMVAALNRQGKPLRQIHWGGGSPTYLTASQIERIHGVVRDSFDVSDDAEIAMEMDPRGASGEKLPALRGMGFNRASIGVQDFDPRVQEHVRREQPYEIVAEFVERCRKLDFDSVNFDLIYGMPFQTVETMDQTVRQAIQLSPDRVAFYHYAQIPDKIATQRGMDYAHLPDSETKLDMFLQSYDRFTEAGYEFIGLDHFAKPGEGLSRALREGTIQRNFQGMTTGGDLALLGVGASAIGHLPGMGYLQNLKETEDYVARLESGQMAVERGSGSQRRIAYARLSWGSCTAWGGLSRRKLTAHSGFASGAISRASWTLWRNWRGTVW